MPSSRTTRRPTTTRKPRTSTTRSTISQQINRVRVNTGGCGCGAKKR